MAQDSPHLLSGGTTGLPKVIPRTHEDHRSNIRCSAAAAGLDRGSPSTGPAAATGDSSSRIASHDRNVAPAPTSRRPGLVGRSAAASDPVAARSLRERAEELTGVRWLPPAR